MVKKSWFLSQALYISSDKRLGGFSSSSSFATLSI
jgi:hypothetical protein